MSGFNFWQQWLTLEEVCLHVYAAMLPEPADVAQSSQNYILTLIHVETAGHLERTGVGAD